MNSGVRLCYTQAMNLTHRMFSAAAVALMAVSVCAQQPPAGPRTLADAAVRGWFPALAQRKPLASRPEVEAVRNLKGELLGWVFSTDQLAPVVRGKRGEIGVWVALGVDGKIRGVKVGRHREDKKWFDRIRDPFYKAFDGRPADGSGGQPDAVTTATVSSRAMIDDVFGACRTVLGLPEVRKQLGAGTGIASDKPAR